MSAKNRYIPDKMMRTRSARSGSVERLATYKIDFEAIYREEKARRAKKINSKNKRGICTILKKFNKYLDIPMNNNLLDVITNYLE